MIWSSRFYAEQSRKLAWLNLAQPKAFSIQMHAGVHPATPLPTDRQVSALHACVRAHAPPNSLQLPAARTLKRLSWRTFLMATSCSHGPHTHHVSPIKAQTYSLTRWLAQPTPNGQPPKAPYRSAA